MRVIPRAVLLAVLTLCVATLVTSVTPATAAPPTNPSDGDLGNAQTTLQQAQAAVETASAELAKTEELLEQREIEAEAAADTYHVAKAEHTAAVETQQLTSTALKQAAAELKTAKADFDELAATTYMMGQGSTPAMLLLESGGPADLIERAGLIDIVTDYHAEQIDAYEQAEAKHTEAAAAADEAVEKTTKAEQAANHALAEANAKLDQAKVEMTTLAEQQAGQESTLQNAQLALADLQGQRAEYEQHLADQAAQQAAAEQEALDAAATSAAQASATPSGGWAMPCGGELTSGYGMRGGSMHNGIDIAAPMYTPIYAVGDGTVIEAGPATGFGQAVLIEHPSGEITLYGHMAVIDVAAGQTVAAGQQIAQVGSEGQSTGPHLHFEVHIGGPYAERIDPLPWLEERGIHY